MNFCKDCKHCVEEYDGLSRDAWGFSKRRYCCGRKRNAVTGEPADCHVERNSYPGFNHCGETGIYFEPKETQND